MAMLGVHATAPQLHQLRAPGVDGRQVKFLVAVQAAHAQGLDRGQQTVGAYHGLGGRIADHQVFAVVVKHVHVVTGQRCSQRGTHFFGKDLKAQLLRQTYFIQVACPAHLQPCGLVGDRLSLWLNGPGRESGQASNRSM